MFLCLCFVLLLCSLANGVTNFVAGCSCQTSGCPVSDLKVFRSENGINWTASTTQVGGGNVNGVAFSPNSGRWVITGQGTSSTYFSDDGDNWTTVTPSNMFTSIGLSVHFFEERNLWFVVGGDAPGTLIWKSNNGSTFTPAMEQPTGFRDIRTVAFNRLSGTFVASGRGNSSSGFARSFDGEMWQSFGSSNLFASGICSSLIFSYSSETWLAAGSIGGIALIQSRDLVTWSPVNSSVAVPNPTFSVFEGGIPLKIFVCGNAPPVLHATNVSAGLTTPISIAGPNAFASDVAFGSGLFVAAFQNGTKYSLDYGSIFLMSDLVNPACNGIAARVNSTLFVPNGSTLSTASSSVVVGAGSNVTAIGNIDIQGILYVQGTLVLAPGSTVTASSVVVSGQITSSGSALLINSTFIIAPNASLVVSSSSSVVTIANYSSVSGAFASVTSTSSACSVSPQYGSSSLTVTIDVSSCTGLSTGAIVGIAIGAAVGGIVLILLVVLAVVMYRRRSDRAANQALRQTELTNR